MAVTRHKIWKTPEYIGPQLGSVRNICSSPSDAEAKMHHLLKLLDDLELEGERETRYHVLEESLVVIFAKS